MCLSGMSYANSQTNSNCLYTSDQISYTVASEAEIILLSLYSYVLINSSYSASSLKAMKPYRSNRLN